MNLLSALFNCTLCYTAVSVYQFISYRYRSPGSPQPTL